MRACAARPGTAGTHAVRGPQEARRRERERAVGREERIHGAVGHTQGHWAPHGADTSASMRTRTCRGARESTSKAPAVVSSKSSTRHCDRVSPHGVSCGRSERQYGRRRALCYGARPVKDSEAEHRGDRRHRAARQPGCAESGVAAPPSCLRALPSASHGARPSSHAPGPGVGTPAPPVTVGGALRAGSMRVCVAAERPDAAAALCSPAAPPARPGRLAVWAPVMRRAARGGLRVPPSPAPAPFHRRRHSRAEG